MTERKKASEQLLQKQQAIRDAAEKGDANAHFKQKQKREHFFSDPSEEVRYPNKYDEAIKWYKKVIQAKRGKDYEEARKVLKRLEK